MTEDTRPLMPVNIRANVEDLKPFTDALVWGLAFELIGALVLAVTFAMPVAPSPYSSDVAPATAGLVIGVGAAAIGTVLVLVGLTRLLNALFVHFASARYRTQ